MKQLLLSPDFQAFREAAREALRQGFLPEEIGLQDATVPTTLSLIADLFQSNLHSRTHPNPPM